MIRQKIIYKFIGYLILVISNIKVLIFYQKFTYYMFNSEHIL